MSFLQLSCNGQQLPIKHMFVASGEMNTADKLTECSKIPAINIIAADGGLNHCNAHNVVPSTVIGDMDSVNLTFLERHRNVIKLDRAKDKTDLEAAIDHAKIDDTARGIIFGGLGKRIDHSMYNLYMLARHPVTLTLETGEETIFALSKQPVTITPKTDAYMTILPFYDDVGRVNLTKEEEPQSFSLHDATFEIEANKECTLCNDEGYVLCIVSDMKLDSPDAFQNFLPRLFSAAKTGSNLQYNDETIDTLNNSKMELTRVPGQTISIIPLLESAKNVITSGLKWNLGGESSELNKDFISVSNVFTEDKASISVGKGTIMVYLPDFIDTQMVELPTKSSTKSSFRCL